MSKHNLIYIILTGVIAVTLIWLSQSERTQIPELESLLEKEVKNNVVNGGPVDTLEGVLWSSDDEGRGNLMLVSGKTTVYIRTTRDFSELIGKDVIASINGTLENFTLLDIEENLTKDGYIKVN